jgi:hypothetical protein
MNKHFLIVWLLLVLLSNAREIRAQRSYTRNMNGWYMYFGTYNFSEHWGLHAEAQWRRHEWIKERQQLLLRTGINYYVNEQGMATLGYCFVETYPYGEFKVNAAFPEHRLWQQFQFKNKVGRVEAINRLRMEQRWINSPVLVDSMYKPGPAVFQQRVRVLNRFSLPLNGKTIGDKSLYVSAYDELFVSFGKEVRNNIFDQNRAYVALGYKVPKLGRVELGYMNQLLMKSDGLRIENNHTLQVALFNNIDLYHK